MKLSTFFTILSPIIATAQAKCYGSGEDWAPDQVQANNVLDDICNSLSGNFAHGEIKYQCRDAGTPDRKLQFWVNNKSGGPTSVSHGDCVLRLGNEINGCSHGGDSDTNQINFRADPNSGRC